MWHKPFVKDWDSSVIRAHVRITGRSVKSLKAFRKKVWLKTQLQIIFFYEITKVRPFSWIIEKFLKKRSWKKKKNFFHLALALQMNRDVEKHLVIHFLLSLLLNIAVVSEVNVSFYGKDWWIRNNSMTDNCDSTKTQSYNQLKAGSPWENIYLMAFN